MKVKYKILIILFTLTLLMFCSGITYSLLHSNALLESTDQGIAKFIFNAENLSEIQLPLIDLKPGDNKDYDFSVSNNYDEKTSNVSIEYQITIKTYHIIPLTIELYKIDDTIEVLTLTCDETYSRNQDNELICNVPIQEMLHSSSKVDNYKLKVKLPSEYNDIVYSGLVDYINIQINSWQKVND